MMRIGIDARLVTFSGIGTYSRSLLQSFAALDKENEYVLFCYQKDAYLMPKQANFSLVFVKDPVFSLFAPKDLTKKIKQANLSLYHALHYVTPGEINCPLVVTIHDLIPLVCPPTLPSFLKRYFYKMANIKAVTVAKAVIAVSEATKKDVVSVLKVPPDKVYVIYEAVAPEFVAAEKSKKNVLAKYDLNFPYLLNVGNAKPHKNWVSLIKAFALFVKAKPDYKLVLVGPSDKRFWQPKKLVSQLGLKNSVFFIDYVPSLDLPQLYKGAAAFIFPSLYEGFGLPPLEAMASSVPVVASNRSAVKEVLDEAALLVDPINIEELADAMKAVITNETLKNSLIEKGKQRLTKFSWQKTAQETLKVYKQVVS